MVTSVTQEHSQLGGVRPRIHFQETPATPTALFRVHKKSIRKAKFFSCSVMTNSNSLTIEILYQDILKEFSLIVFNRINSEKSKTFFERFPLQKYSYWVINYSLLIH